MKAVFYISILVTLIVSSCATGGMYLGSEYDDLYYSPADKPVVQKAISSQNFAGDLEQDQYYDNIYAADTLIADEYNDAVNYENSNFYSQENSVFEYMDDFSYSNRLRRFYGNYFYPYWTDPFYYSSMNYPYYGYNYYDPFYYNPFYYSYGYGSMYNRYYGSY